MHRPLDGIPAIVLCPGPDLPADKLGVFRDYFTIGVNKLWQKRRDFHPTVAFWVDPDGPDGYPEWYEYSLCVCDKSAAPSNGHLQSHSPPIMLDLRGALSLPAFPRFSPRQLYHRPSAGVIAALWAISLGCYPVCGLGMGCEDDGRPKHQLDAMRDARADLLMADYRPDGDWRPAFWLWEREHIENGAVWASRIHSPRLRKRGPGGEAVKAILRQFYG
jgi:hypothetical protein